MVGPAVGAGLGTLGGAVTAFVGGKFKPCMPKSHGLPLTIGRLGAAVGPTVGDSVGATVSGLSSLGEILPSWF